MKLILLQNALTKAQENAREALKLVAELKADPRCGISGLDPLRENVEQIINRLQTAIPEDVRQAVENELMKLSSPQFGWCAECGAEWVARGSITKEPATRCKVCKAGNESRVMEKPQNPPKKDFRQNPLMDFLDLVEKEK